MVFQRISISFVFVCVAAIPVLSQHGVTHGTEKLATLLQGMYSNEAQSRVDTSYFDVRLRIVRIWRARTDAVWLYAEQSLASMQSKPYSQRIYCIQQKNDSAFESKILTLRYPLRFAGEWRRENLLKNQTPDSLTERTGCELLFYRRNDGIYVGATIGSGCQTYLRGSAYTTSGITVFPEKLIVWERGFDSSGKQTWGAIKGGYEFIKMKE